MPLRPLNDTLIVIPDPIEKYVGVISLPEKNTEEKISHWATIVSWGSKCFYRYRIGQRVIIDRFFDSPAYVEVEGNRYRLIKEHYIHAVEER